MIYKNTGKVTIAYDPSQPPTYKRGRSWFFHLRKGIRYGYPPCCIAGFILDSFIEWAGFAYRPSAALRGVCHGERPGKVWVACGVFHKGNPLPKDGSYALCGDLVKPWERLRRA